MLSVPFPDFRLWLGVLGAGLYDPYFLWRHSSETFQSSTVWDVKLNSLALVDI